MFSPVAKAKPGSRIEKEATKWAEEQGWFSFKIEKANKRGVPDRFYSRIHPATFRTQVVFVEFKGPRETVSEQQKRRIKDLSKSGVSAWVCRDLTDFKFRMQ